MIETARLDDFGNRLKALVVPGAQPSPAERDRAAPPGVQSPALPANAAQMLAERLAKLDGLTVGYREWPGLGHGAMLGAAIEPALNSVAYED